MPASVQHQLPTNLTQLNFKLAELNITLTPFLYGLVTSLAKCTNQSESEIYWLSFIWQKNFFEKKTINFVFLFRWDNSAAQLMIQLQNNITNGFCKEFQQVQSLYILSASANQLFGHGVMDFENIRPNIGGLSNYTICTQVDSDIFLTEFLTKISSKKPSSCEKIYENRFDIKLQSCLMKYGYD